MEALLRRKLSSEIRGLLTDRLGHINHQYPRVRAVYQMAYHRENLDKIRSEAALCAILGLYAASVVLTDQLLAEHLRDELHEHRPADDFDAAAGAAVLFEMATRFGIVTDAEAAQLGSLRLSAREYCLREVKKTPETMPDEEVNVASRASATDFLLAVDAAIRKRILQARAA
jgi:hypothetical protein